MDKERVVELRPRTVAMVAGVLLGIAAALWVVWTARQVLAWVLIALFLSLALNPAVDWVQHRGVRRRGAATGIVFTITLVAVAALIAGFGSVVVQQVNDFIDAVPGYVDDLTHGRGPLGFLETKYHVVDRVREAINSGGGNVGNGVHAVVSVTRSIVTGVAGLVTIIFMTLFMLLEGPRWVERFYASLESESERRWRDVGYQIYRTVGGYVTGNLVISFIAGTATTIMLLILGIPFPVALGLLVAILDLIPLAGATLAAIIVTLVALTQGTTEGVVVLIFFIVYQQLENHVLQPVVYGRTVQLSPLVVLIAVLIGAEIAGVLGALGAIPIAGSIQVLITDWQRNRREQRARQLDGTPIVTPAGAAGAPSGVPPA
jgi:predicted PurR-regulated permease PerM